MKTAFRNGKSKYSKKILIANAIAYPKGMKTRIPHNPSPQVKKQRHKDAIIDSVKILIGVKPKNVHGLLIVLLDLRSMMFLV